MLILFAIVLVALIGFGLVLPLLPFFAARPVQGACAGNIAAAQAYVADVTTPENRAKGMGLIGAAFGFGFIIGPALGGLLAGPDPEAPPLSAPAFLGAGLSALAFIGTVFFLKESLPPSAQSAPRKSR